MAGGEQGRFPGLGCAPGVARGFGRLVLQVTRHKRCRFKVTVLDKPGEVPQQGHKVRPEAMRARVEAGPSAHQQPATLGVRKGGQGGVWQRPRLIPALRSRLHAQ